MLKDEVCDLAIFAAVADARSFTRAAAKLGKSQSALSQSVRRLEERLKLRLLTRTTRSVMPTPAGEQLLSTLRPALGEIEAQLNALSELRELPSGSLRLTAGRHAVETVLWPALLRLNTRYPDIKVEVSIEPALIDIVTEQYDAGVRQGEQIARDMIALRIGPDLRRVVVGCPAYLADHGIPVEPQDLTHHRCCNIRLPTSGGLYAWEFERDGRSVNVHVDGPFVLNDMHLLIDAALHGAGLAIVMEDMVAPFIADGRLVRVLEDWSPPPATISITLTGATPPRRSLRFWRNYAPTLIYKQGESRHPQSRPAPLSGGNSLTVTSGPEQAPLSATSGFYEHRRRNWRLTFAAADFLVGPQLIDFAERPLCARSGSPEALLTQGAWVMQKGGPSQAW